MVLNDSIRFYGTFRPYQQRALDNLEKYLDNDKIHIVAAPGSGKTILGLELIRRINKTTLVLVPSITIREQWITRFKENFIDSNLNYEDYISSSILEYKPIMCITYQALYCAYQRLKNNETEEDIKDDENYDNFDLIDTLVKYNVRTICLDECHHLKSEWWKALETTISRLDSVKLISLTATPPYDSMSSEWSRYATLCGPIDDEIFVPELVKDKNLCYHQDYIYYSYPTDKETEVIMKHYSTALKFFYKYRKNEELVNIVASQNIHNDNKKFFGGFYLYPNYYQAVVLFLKDNGIKINPKIQATILRKKFDKKCFETLIQNVIYDDSEAYPSSGLLATMKKELAALGLSNHRKISLTNDEKVDKILSSSLSKLNSIEEIVRYEEASLKDKLRCLILTDYIKISNLKEKIDSFGSVPIFNYLNNAKIKGIKLCLLTGSICIIPKSIEEKLLEEDNSFTFSKVNDEYDELKVSTTNRKKVVSILTNFFVQGYFNVIIGTKALLGEGWDSPCINSLILASNIGSYVTSNQTRGRAIRIDRKNLDKVSSIWHLVTINPMDKDENEDFNTISRRFDSFVGVNFEGNRIENGVERLNTNKIPITHEEIRIENNNTMKEAINKKKIKNSWDYCIENAKEIEMLHKVSYVEKKRLRLTLSFFLAFILSGVYSYLIIFLIQGYSRFFMGFKYGWILTFIGVLVCLYFLIENALRIIRQFRPKYKLKYIGNAILRSLKAVGAINSSNVVVRTSEVKNQQVGVYLKNATIYEQNIFSLSILEMLGNVNQPRYLICRLHRLVSDEFYVVPSILKKNRESVDILRNEMKKMFGFYGFVFYKNERGIHYALKARFLYENLMNSPNVSAKLLLLPKNKSKIK